MRALILAAGQGRRLWPYTATGPKCLLPVGDQSILERQLTAMEQVGVRQVVIVCGYGDAAIRRLVHGYTGPADIKLLFNPFYHQSDNLISLWAARSEMDQDFILCNGDNVFDPSLLDTLLADPSSCCLLTQRQSVYTDEDMMVYYVKDRIRHIGKNLVPASADAVSIGLMRFSGASVGVFRDILEQKATAADVMHSYFLTAIQSLIDQDYPVIGCDIGDRFWIDVDTPEDLAAARRHIAAITALCPALQRYMTIEGQA